MATLSPPSNFEWTTKNFTCLEVTVAGSEMPVTSPLGPNETVQLQVQEPCFFSTTAAAPAKLLHQTRITSEARLSLASMLRQGDEGRMHTIPNDNFYIWVPYNSTDIADVRGGITQLEFPNLSIQVMRVKKEGHGLSSTRIIKTVSLKMGIVTTTRKVQAQIEREFLGELNLVQGSATRREPLKAESFGDATSDGDAITHLFKTRQASCLTACFRGG